MKRRYILSATASALILATLAWYFGSPHWTLRQMRTAALAGDDAALAYYIDFAEVRKNTKAQLRAEYEPLLRNIPADLPTRTQTEAQIRHAFSDEAIDFLVNPEVMRGMFGRDPYGGMGSGIEKETGRDDSIVMRGIDEFRLHDSKRKDEGGDLVFRRYGLGWKLVAVRWRGQ